MPDLIHFCTEATKDINNLEEGYRSLKENHEDSILNIEIVYPYMGTAFVSGTMWCEDAGLPPWELSLAFDDIKFRTIEPFYIEF